MKQEMVLIPKEEYDKLKKQAKIVDDTMHQIIKLKGTSKKRTTDKEYETNREKAFKEISKKVK